MCFRPAGSGGTVKITFPELLRVFARIGVLSFGGPAAQIAVMHRELVEERPWLSERQFLSALSFCMLLPGPEAMQLATYCGWWLRGVPGGVVAGLLFVIPGALFMLALAMLYATFGQAPVSEALFLGVKATVVVIVLQALVKVSGRALLDNRRRATAVLSFVAIFMFAAPFPLIIACAAAFGATSGTDETKRAPLPTGTRTMRTVALWAALWWVPVGIFMAIGHQFLTQVGLFFSKLAVVTFGGAYAVLAYMTQEVVQDRGWLTTVQMMDGLGLADTTPGPLILVTEFVAFLAGHGAGGVGLAALAAALALWVTFVPCFLWIFAGAPYLEWISTRPRLSGALESITAAVVGVILNLSLWFASHVFFAEVSSVRFGPLHLLAPNPETLDWSAVALAIAAGIAVFGLKWGLLRVLAASALAGAALSAVT